MNKKKIIFPVLFFFMMILMISGCALVKGDPTTEEDSLDASGVKGISVDYGSVDVVVEGGSSSQLEVVFDTFERGPKLSMNRRGDHVDIATERGGLQIGFIKLGGYSSDPPKMTVKIPNNHKQDLKLEGSSGNVQLRNLNLNQIDFSASASDVNGGGITANRINGSSTSGSISIAFEKFATDANLSSSSGNIDLSLNDESPDLTLETATTSGNRKIDFPMSGSEESGTIGEGTHHVQLETTSGNISVTP
ncbi:DUF4097 family beta strand repeat-containing protein [Paludifilum halophilum]|uniref:DUF4097 domain-containing protein n=1 Tax=Paludifilum halophilum TaxID=1642702 RepID=A0A235BBF6_9BACL|nr:DUF4097 family beta strand repeat-containing protein [Paludifilum halophilum]OYD09606.1 hypothetical protein CHM34_00935 [Paludifilum halophilum]